MNVPPAVLSVLLVLAVVKEVSSSPLPPEASGGPADVASPACVQRLLHQDVVGIRPLRLNAEVSMVMGVWETLLTGVKFVAELAPEDPVIRADAKQLQYALVNLVMNAGHAIGRRAGRITLRTMVVSVEEPIAYRKRTIAIGKYSVLQVVDDGPGIKEDIIDKIFELYFTTKGSEGTGIGLANVARFVEGLGGHVLAQSTEGQGAVFSLYFQWVTP